MPVIRNGQYNSDHVYHISGQWTTLLDHAEKTTHRKTLHRRHMKILIVINYPIFTETPYNFFSTIIIFIIIMWIIFRPFIDLKDPCDKSSFGSLSNCCAKWQGEHFVAMGSRPFMAPPFFFVKTISCLGIDYRIYDFRQPTFGPFFCRCLLYLFTSGEFPSSDTFIKTSR